MGKHIEIKWQGRAGQGVTTAAALLAQIMALDGKWVQAFPEFIPVKRRPSILAFNRISDTPIKSHAEVKEAGTMVLMDVRLFMHASFKRKIAPDAAYIINTSHEPDFIKEKLNLAETNKIYTLDADTIAAEEIGEPFPNIPLMTVLINMMELIPVESFKEKLDRVLSLEFDSKLAAANIKTVERALKEVKTYEP